MREGLGDGVGGRGAAESRVETPLEKIASRRYAPAVRRAWDIVASISAVAHRGAGNTPVGRSPVNRADHAKRAAVLMCVSQFTAERLQEVRADADLLLHLAGGGAPGVLARFDSAARERDLARVVREVGTPEDEGNAELAGSLV